MPESKRLEAATSETADRDSRAEALLVEGLDRYFAGQYEDAIHVWTRVLFLDRSHARARAYIDRARTAVAERHRRSEELLHTASRFLEQGEVDRARAFLTQLEAANGDDQHTAALRARVDRMERARGETEVPRVPPAGTHAVSGGRKRRVSWTHVVTGGLVAGSAALVALATVLVLQLSLGWGVSSQRLPASGRAAPLPVLSSADVALVRARTLYARGRLAEALAALDRVERAHPRRGEADKLRIDIQRVLLGDREPGVTSERGSE